MLHVLWTVTILKSPYIPKVFIYTRAVKMFIINLIVRKSSVNAGYVVEQDPKRIVFDNLLLML